MRLQDGYLDGWTKGRHAYWCMQVDSKTTKECLLVSGCSVVGWTILAVACLSIVGISVVADDNEADFLRDDVKLISFELLLAVANVIDKLFVAVARVAVLALDENTRCVDVSPTDSDDDANPLWREIMAMIISNTHC